ncbi:MAG TPA: AraC family transcriptional regulator [Vicinamibacterales bacterium]|nr:AraC family transcriptional regulator [Vicinamibacterales bacterium]
MNVTSKPLWYIEAHLSGDLSLDAIAAVVGVARFHLSRAFGVTVGDALASYVRARRLTEAARAMAGGAPDILAVALESGYGSPGSAGWKSGCRSRTDRMTLTRAFGAGRTATAQGRRPESEVLV